MTTNEKMMMQPTSEYIRKLLRQRNEGTEDCILSSELAKEFGISAPDLHMFLIDMKFLYRENSTRELKLCKKYDNQGFAKYRSSFRYTKRGELKEIRFPVWTEKGQDYIRKKLRNRN